MSTPTQRHTSSRKRIRRGKIKLSKINLAVCPKCKKPVRAHRACTNCGTYKSRDVFKVRVPKKFRKKKEKEQKELAAAKKSSQQKKDKKDNKAEKK